MKDKLSTSPEVQLADMQNYYRVQAQIYDITRWLFLFGRNKILTKLPFERSQKLNILDVGCGTGVNSKKLAKRFPNATITGLDVSAHMLDRAEKKLSSYQDRVKFINKPYERGSEYHNSFDLILFSYALTMINPQWSELIEQAQYDLKPEGYIAVVDFHDTASKFYKKFMRANHVRLDGQLLPVLEEKYDTLISKVKKGYLGYWEYMIYVGKQNKK